MKHSLTALYSFRVPAQPSAQFVPNQPLCLWADPAYWSEEIEARLRSMKLKSHIHRKGKRVSTQ